MTGRKISYAQKCARKLLYRELEIVINGLESLMGEPTEDTELLEAQDQAVELVLNIICERRGAEFTFTENDCFDWCFGLLVIVGLEKSQRDLEIKDYRSTGIELHDTHQAWNE